MVLIIGFSSYAEENYSGYDSIIRELSGSQHSSISTTSSGAMDVIRFHAGVGMIATHVSLDLPKPLPQKKTLRGFEARLGIDLFSPRWVAEGAVRTFDPENIAEGQISLREFDLLVVYKNRAAKSLEMSIGGGMSARYLDITGGVAGEFPRSNTTPASVFLFGLNAYITPAFSLGAQVSYRSPLVQETVDNGSFDGGLKIAGHW